jgi:predicted nucleic acid-binding protein
VATVTRGEPVFLSPVTITELQFGAEIAKDLGVRQKRLVALLRLQRNPLFRLPAEAGSYSVRSQHNKAAGRQHRYRMQDLWLASHAIQHGCGPLTRRRAVILRTFRGWTWYYTNSSSVVNLALLLNSI